MALERISYLLPCNCGRSLPIEISQAGDVVECECGQRLEVPTMREIRKLALADPDAPAGDEGAWDLRKGLMLSGGLLIAVAVALAVWLWWKMPTKPTLDIDLVTQTQEQQIDKMSVADTWRLWVIEIEGRGLQKYPSKAEEAYRLSLRMFNYGFLFALALALTGGALALGAAARRPRAGVGQARAGV